MNELMFTNFLETKRVCGVSIRVLCDSLGNILYYKKVRKCKTISSRFRYEKVGYVSTTEIDIDAAVCTPYTKSLRT